MYNRIIYLPLDAAKSIFLFGPRGTGKTAWVKNALPQANYVDLLDFNIYKELQGNPTRLINFIKNPQNWIIIDEIQRIPELLNEVHRLIESNHYKFLLTGSSARKLRRHGTNLLAGRALRYHMHPFIYQELGANFSLEKVLQFGLLPEAITADNPSKYLQTYVETYLREEVLQEGLTRNLSAFARFLETASFSQGSIINASEISREVGMSRHTINDYFNILDDLLLSIRLYPFTRRAKRHTIAHPKFYFFDVGIYQFLRPQGPLDKREEIDGASLETLFLQSARAINDYYNLDYNFYFWQTVLHQEVDFILYGERGLHAFEIKHTNTVTAKTLKGLQAFAEEYPEAKLYLLYLGKHEQRFGNIQVLPMVTALSNLPQLLNPKVVNSSNGVRHNASQNLEPFSKS